MSKYTGINPIVASLFKEKFYIATMYFTNRPPFAIDKDVELSYDNHIVTLSSESITNPFRRTDKDPTHVKDIKLIPDGEFVSIDYLYENKIITNGKLKIIH